VASLGAALAEINQRVLLIDADMRKPQLHHLFGVSNSWGLSDLLRENNPLHEVPTEAIAKRTELQDLSLLPSGPGTATIANLLYSKRLNTLIERVRNDFDTILIDTPPMSYMSDARVLGRVADAVVLVIRAGQTTRDEARAVRDRLGADGTRLLGTILNGWDARSKTRYYRYSEVSDPS
jgi:capsular exopolysaccharide synthesis family protein